MNYPAKYDKKEIDDRHDYLTPEHFKEAYDALAKVKKELLDLIQ